MKKKIASVKSSSRHKVAKWPPSATIPWTLPICKTFKHLEFLKIIPQNLFRFFTEIINYVIVISLSVFAMIFQNNLLENREMHLEDGRLLIPAERYDKLLEENGQEELDKWQLVRVSEDFRVVALGLPIPHYTGNPLDPPLRSRFQARDVRHISFGEQLKILEEIGPELSSDTVGQLLSLGMFDLNLKTLSIYIALSSFEIKLLKLLPNLTHIIRYIR